MKKLLLNISSIHQKGVRYRVLMLTAGVCMLMNATVCRADYSSDALRCSSRLEWCIKGTGTGKGCGELAYLTRDEGKDKEALQRCEQLKPSLGLDAACQAGVEILKNKNLCDGPVPLSTPTCTALQNTCISFINEGSPKNPCDMVPNKKDCQALLNSAKNKHPLGSNAYQFICTDFMNGMKNKNMCE